ncbi:MAG TPA: protein kinase [Gemmatimonadales bacterium]|nr:protein kinase [Gemmatimonadales bacterium]
MLERLQRALADRYHLERELGSGGMATVYLAEDLKHHRRVAIKVLRPEIGAALGAERFLREIETTANLRHPHILPLYDSGRAETGGGGRGRAEFLYYVMPYVEGESLRDRLNREKQLPLDDALRIAREVADALSYAHSRGVIHRDIKPENILLESGHAVVADFGIARAVDAAGGERLTETGLSIGTPTYMSPEQAAGDRDLDGRSDLYSLGCVLYEMLGGQPPFTGATVESVVHQHVMVNAPPITNLRPAVPAAVAAALQRALAKAPADRFNPVAQFADALGAPPTATPPQSVQAASPRHMTRGIRAVLAIVAVAVVVVAAVFGIRAWRARSGQVAAASIAVLPFTDVSPNHAEAYLGDGIAETLINALTNVPGLEVAGRTSTFSLRGADQDVRAIGRRLGVATVLEGSVQRAGDSLRVTAQLIKTADGINVWSRSFDRSARDIFAVQDEVARAVVTALRGNVLGAADTALAAQGTDSPAAYDAYLLGRYYWNKRTADGMVKAAAYFEQAIADDSTYARAWSGLADSYVLFIPPEYDVAGINADSILDLAEHAARRAVQLAPDLGETYASLGEVLEYRNKWPEARQAFERAVRLGPNYPTAHQWYSYDLMLWNRWDEAIQEMERAKELDPLSMVIVVSLAAAYDGAERWGDAAKMYDQAAALAPNHQLVVSFRFWHDLLAGTTDRWGPDYRRFALATGTDTAQAEAMARRLAAPATREDALRALLRSGSPYVQLVAARALGGTKAAIPLVTALVHDPRRERVNKQIYVCFLGTALRADPRVQAAMVQWGAPKLN